MRAGLFGQFGRQLVSSSCQAHRVTDKQISLSRRACNKLTADHWRHLHTHAHTYSAVCIWLGNKSLLARLSRYIIGPQQKKSFQNSRTIPKVSSVSRWRFVMFAWQILCPQNPMPDGARWSGRNDATVDWTRAWFPQWHRANGKTTPKCRQLYHNLFTLPVWEHIQKQHARQNTIFHPI